MRASLLAAAVKPIPFRSAGPLPAARMMSLVDLFQPIKCHVSIDLRGGYVGMSQNGLHGTQICAVTDHVRGTTVAQHMWTGLAVRL